ncbi:MAG TPA: S41 family peptidase [Terriglobia bacterium]|nr:S41 family peptidase [Terriglobia bacterium]
MSKRVRSILILVTSVLVLYTVIGSVLGEGESSNEQTYRDLGVYSEVLSRIKSDYVTEPNLQNVTRGAIRGLLEALDPYSTYFTPKQFQDFLAHPDSGPASVGIFLSKKFGFATVVAVLPGSPADKAGIKPGDLIDRIGESSSRELSVIQLDRELGGDPGSTVDVWVVKGARGEPQKMTLTRVIPQIDPVTAKLMDDGTGYVRISAFDKGEAEKISESVKSLEGQGAKRIVLDLRDCAGGSVNEAVDTASLFIKSGLIAYTYGQRTPRHDIMAQPPAVVFNMPLAVLINRSTAGPAEIVADAVLCDKRGDVVGVPSFGVGVVQKTIPVGDGSGLLLSVAKYYGPDGKAIEDNGVTPNVLSPTEEQAEAMEASGQTEQPDQFGTKADIQLQRAIEVLKQNASPVKAA